MILPLAPAKDLILRDYQIESIEALRGNIRAGHVRQVLASPTGSGKSIIMLDMVRSAVEKNSKVLFICERRVLVEQFSKHLDSINIQHGVMMANHWRHDPQSLVQVASAQTLERMEYWPDFEIVFIDELHAALRKSIIKMIETRPDMRIIGATATPFHPMIPKHFSAITNVISMRELVEKGNLIPFKVFVAHEIDVTGLKVVAGEFKKDDLEKRGQMIIGDVVADYVRLSHEVFGGYRKTICFSCGVAHGAELAQKFQEAGINAVQISYMDSDEFKAEVMADFARPDTEIQMLISTDILGRGFDQSDVEHVILTRAFKKSFSAFVQQIGRGARPHEGQSFCLVQDHSGNWLRFADSWDDFYENGVTELTGDQDANPRKEKTEKEKKAAVCPKCTAAWPAKSDICSHCGHVRERKSKVAAVPGRMEAVNGVIDLHHNERREFYAGLLNYATRRGYKTGWAYFKFQEKFPGSKPPSVPAGTGEISGEVLRWIRSRNIRYAKRRA